MTFRDIRNKQGCKFLIKRDIENGLYAPYMMIPYNIIGKDVFGMGFVSLQSGAISYVNGDSESDRKFFNLEIIEIV